MRNKNSDFNLKARCLAKTCLTVEHLSCAYQSILFFRGILPSGRRGPVGLFIKKPAMAPRVPSLNPAQGEFFREDITHMAQK